MGRCEKMYKNLYRAQLICPRSMFNSREVIFLELSLWQTASMLRASFLSSNSRSARVPMHGIPLVRHSWIGNAPFVLARAMFMLDVLIQHALLYTGSLPVHYHYAIIHIRFACIRHSALRYQPCDVPSDNGTAQRVQRVLYERQRAKLPPAWANLCMYVLSKASDRARILQRAISADQIEMDV